MKMKNKIIDAYKTLFLEAWERVKKELHPDDYPRYLKKFNQRMKDFEKNPEDFVDDCINDIRAMFS